MTTYTEAGEALSNHNLPDGWEEWSDQMWFIVVKKMEQDMAGWIASELDKVLAQESKGAAHQRAVTALGLIRTDNIT